MFLWLFQCLRALVGLIDLVIFTAFLYLLSFIPKKHLGKWYRWCFRQWCWIFIRALRVSLFLHEKNHKPLPQHYILIGNHPSAFEDIGMSALFDVYYLAKIEVKDWWIVGRISQAAGTYYVARDLKESRNEASQTLKQALNEGKNIGIYPEGGCKGRRIHPPFRYGVFDLSIQTGVPIIPVFLHYEQQAQFEWQNQHLLHKLWMIFSAQNHRVNYYVYDAIYPHQFTSKEMFAAYVETCYLNWQNRYLD